MKGPGNTRAAALPAFATGLQQQVVLRQAALQHLAGNRVATRHVTIQRQAMQRHGDAELRQQIVIDEEEPAIQARHDPAGPQRIQRHPLKPNTELLHQAPFGKRDAKAMVAIVNDAALQDRIKKSLLKLAGANLQGDELKNKTALIKGMTWTLDPDFQSKNPAQANASGIRLWYYHAEFYTPDGAPRVEFIKSTMLHEGLHFVSNDHTGFQSAGDKFDANSANDTLDEAVTERIGEELAADVLGKTEAYTTSYWNIGGRKGLDFHLTFQGLELLASSEAALWLGDLIPVITAKTGLTWEAIRAAYLSDEGSRNQTVVANIESHRAAIEAEWKTRKAAALKAQLGAHGIEKNDWEATLKQAIANVESAVGPADPTERSKDALKTAIDTELAALTGAPHQVVTKQDSRTSSADDWKLVRDNTKKFTPPAGKTKAAVWTETTEQTTGGKVAQPSAAAEEAWKTEDENNKPHARPPKAISDGIPDVKLRTFVERANRLLGYILKKHPMGWVIVPDDPTLKGSTPFAAYPALAVKMLQPENLQQSLSSIMGAAPNSTAREIVGGFGGAGYETNGDVGLINIEHVNLASVVHEMGHHKQKYEKNLSEENVNQIKGAFPILDLHNILYSENQLAAAELKKDPTADPFVRLRYTEKPVRMRLSEWVKAAASQSESEDFKRFKGRALVKGGSLAAILAAIEQELAANNALYPGNVPVLFKNLMVKEIRLKSKEVEPTDVSK